MDQIGAFAGPLIFSLVLLLSNNNYSIGYTVLWIPFVLLMISVVIAYKKVPAPEKLEESVTPKTILHKDKLPKVFWLYTIFIFFSVMGFVNFALLGFHFKAVGVLSDVQIPLFYAIAMIVDAIVAIAIGKLYDKYGLITLVTLPIFSLAIPFLGFSNNFVMVIISVMLWGMAMAVHETIMKAAIADLTSIKKRGTGYGIFNTSYGLAWLIGSSLMGLLYEKIGIVYVIIFSVAFQVLSVPLFLLVRREALIMKKANDEANAKLPQN
jgi:predicted MFS family arabinose efflux permease